MLIDKLAACKFFYKFRNIYLIPYNVIQKNYVFLSTLMQHQFIWFVNKIPAFQQHSKSS